MARKEPPKSDSTSLKSRWRTEGDIPPSTTTPGADSGERLEEALHRTAPAPKASQAQQSPDVFAAVMVEDETAPVAQAPVAAKVPTKGELLIARAQALNKALKPQPKAEAPPSDTPVAVAAETSGEIKLDDTPAETPLRKAEPLETEAPQQTDAAEAAPETHESTPPEAIDERPLLDKAGITEADIDSVQVREPKKHKDQPGSGGVRNAKGVSDRLVTVEDAPDPTIEAMKAHGKKHWKAYVGVVGLATIAVPFIAGRGKEPKKPDVIKPPAAVAQSMLPPQPQATFQPNYQQSGMSPWQQQPFEFSQPPAPPPARPPIPQHPVAPPPFVQQPPVEQQPVKPPVAPQQPTQPQAIPDDIDELFGPAETPEAAPAAPDPQQVYWEGRVKAMTPHFDLAATSRKGGKSLWDDELPKEYNNIVRLTREAQAAFEKRDVPECVDLLKEAGRLCNQYPNELLALNKDLLKNMHALQLEEKGKTTEAALLRNISAYGVFPLAAHDRTLKMDAYAKRIESLAQKRLSTYDNAMETLTKGIVLNDSKLILQTQGHLKNLADVEGDITEAVKNQNQRRYRIDSTPAGIDTTRTTFFADYKAYTTKIKEAARQSGK